MKNLVVVCCLFICLGAYSQSKNELFEKSKGTLTSGLKQGLKLDMTNIDASIRPKNAVFITYSADSARAVFEGTVSEIAEVPSHEDNYIVAIVYGDYTITYSFIRKPIVSVGEHVKQGQALGALAPVPAGPYYFMMQIFKGETEMEAWSWFKK